MLDLLQGPQHIPARGFFQWKVLRSFLTAFLPVTLFQFLFTLFGIQRADRQSYSHFATETVESQKMEIVSFLFKLQALLSWNLSSDLGPASSLQCPLEQVSSHIKPQLPTENWWKRILCPTSSDAVSELRVWCRKASVLPQAEEWGQGFRHTGGHRSPRNSSSRQLLSLLPRDSCQAGWVMQRYEGHPFKTDGGLRGPLAESWGRMCSLPLTWPTLFYFIWKKFIGSTCKW